MNKKQFRQAMLRGQGRCIQALRQDPECYRDQVLWGCTHQISFDPSCEGSRSLY